MENSALRGESPRGFVLDYGLAMDRVRASAIDSSCSGAQPLVLRLRLHPEALQDGLQGFLEPDAQVLLRFRASQKVPGIARERVA